MVNSLENIYIENPVFVLGMGHIAMIKLPGFKKLSLE